MLFSYLCMNVTSRSTAVIDILFDIRVLSNYLIIVSIAFINHGFPLKDIISFGERHSRPQCSCTSNMVTMRYVMFTSVGDAHCNVYQMHVCVDNSHVCSCASKYARKCGSHSCRYKRGCGIGFSATNYKTVEAYISNSKRVNCTP